MIASLIPLCGAWAFELQEGDVIVWKSKTFEYFDIEVPVAPIERYHETQLFSHADYVGPDGRLYTSIQGKGSSSSTVERRLKYFDLGVVLRDSKLLPFQISAYSQCMMGQDVEYDYVKNIGIATDSLLWGNSVRLFGYLGFYPIQLVCSNAVTRCVPNHSVREDWISSPSDIYYWEGWEVAGTFNYTEKR
jgi:hypothetical protein